MFVDATDELRNLDVISLITPFVLPVFDNSPDTNSGDSDGMMEKVWRTFGLEVMGILRLLLVLNSDADWDLKVVSYRVDGFVTVADFAEDDSERAQNNFNPCD